MSPFNNPPYTIVPAQPGCWLIEFSDGDTEAFLLEYAQMIVAWRIDRFGSACPITPLTGEDNWLPEMAILLPDGRVKNDHHTFRSMREWIESMQEMKDTGRSWIACLPRTQQGGAA